MQYFAAHAIPRSLREALEQYYDNIRMASLPSILVSPRSASDIPCFLSGDVVLIQQAKGLRHSVL